MSNELLTPYRRGAELVLDALKVGVPASISVALTLSDRVSTLTKKASANNDDVGAALDHRVDGAVLLAKTITLIIKTHAGGQDQKVLVRGLIHTVLRNEAKDKLLVVFSNLNGLLGVLASGQRSLAGKLGQHDEATVGTGVLGHVLGGSGLESLDNAVAGDTVRVRDVSPLHNAVDAAGVLVLDGGANVCKLAVLKQHKVVLVRQGHQRLNGTRVGEVRDDVNVGLDHDDVGAKLVGQGKQLGRGGHVERCAQVGLFGGHEIEQSRGCGAAMLLCACLVAKLNVAGH